jgi:hypothetical protein
MSEVSIVRRLVFGILGIALTAACVGTLGDLVLVSRNRAALTVQKGGISYGEWNRRLHKAPRSALKSDKTASK